MTFAIKWGSFDSEDNNAGFLYFDAITSSSQNYRGQTTKHPVDAGGNITDHFIRDNPVFQFTGIITGTDLSSSSFIIKDEQGGSAYNAKQEPVSIALTNTNSKLLQFLPTSISQFLGKQDANLIFDPTSRTDLQYEIACRDIIVNLIQGISYNSETQTLENKINLIDLYEFDDTNIRRITNNLVLTNFSVTENPDSGDALFFDMTLEQVEFAVLKKESLPQDVSEKLKKPVQTKKKKGKVDCTSKDMDSAKDGKDPSAPESSASGGKDGTGNEQSLLKKGGTVTLEKLSNAMFGG